MRWSRSRRMERSEIAKISKILAKFLVFLSLFIFVFLTESIPILLTISTGLFLFFLLNRSARGRFKFFMRGIAVILFTSFFGLFRVNGKILLSLGPVILTTGGIQLAVLTFLKLSSITLLSFMTFTKLDPSEFTTVMRIFLSLIPIPRRRKDKILFILTLSYEFTPTLFEKFGDIVEKEKGRTFLSKIRRIPKIIGETVDESLKKVERMLEERSKEFERIKLDG